MVKINRNRTELLYEDEDDAPNEKLDKIIQKEKERLEREKNEKKDAEKKRSEKKNGPADERIKKTQSKDSADKDRPSTSKGAKDDKSKQASERKQSESPAPGTSKNKRQSSPIRDVVAVKKLKETKDRKYKPFHKLLEGVVLVISGIQVGVRSVKYSPF